MTRAVLGWEQWIPRPQTQAGNQTRRSKSQRKQKKHESFLSGTANTTTLFRIFPQVTCPPARAGLRRCGHQVSGVTSDATSVLETRKHTGTVTQRRGDRRTAGRSWRTGVGEERPAEERKRPGRVKRCTLRANSACAQVPKTVLMCARSHEMHLSKTLTDIFTEDLLCSREPGQQQGGLGPGGPLSGRQPGRCCRGRRHPQQPCSWEIKPDSKQHV